MDHTALLSCVAGSAVVEVGLFLSMQLTERSPADSLTSADFSVMAVLGRGDFFVQLRWCAEPELNNVDKNHMGFGESMLYLTV